MLSGVLVALNIVDVVVVSATSTEVVEGEASCVSRDASPTTPDKLSDPWILLVAFWLSGFDFTLAVDVSSAVVSPVMV